MRLSQIIAEADDHVNYDGLDPNVIERLSEYKPHQQQWAVRELRNGGDVNSVVDALDYYISKIGDNRFQNILKSKTPTPKNIVSLSIDDIKAAQHDFETKYNSLSKREREHLRSNVLLDTPGLKIVEFKKSGADDVDTAKALAVAAQFTKWCVVNIETGNGYLDQGPIYLITMGDTQKCGGYKTVVPGGQPVAINQYLCHVASKQLMDVYDEKKKLSEQVCLMLKEYIAGVGIFCDNKNSDAYRDAIKHSPKLLYYYARDVIGGRWPEAEPTIMKDPSLISEYAHYVIKGRWPEAEPTIMQNSHYASFYARDVIRGRWPEAEPYIMQDPDPACWYARAIMCKWPEAEPTIMQDPGSACSYAVNVLRHRWPEAEPTIMQDPGSACWYAHAIIGGRWPEAEPTIMKKPESAYDYAHRVIKGRWPEAEPIIMKNPGYAYAYAHNIIKGRWPKAEPTIIKDPFWACEYAFNVIEGRWPEAEPTIMQNNYYWNQYQQFYKLNQPR